MSNNTSGIEVPRTIEDAKQIAETGDGHTLVEAFVWLIATTRDDNGRAMLDIIISEIKARCDIALSSTEHH